LVEFQFNGILNYQSSATDDSGVVKQMTRSGILYPVNGIAKILCMECKGVHIDDTFSLNLSLKPETLKAKLVV
jgi:hypothetical protein